jgi:hypothetical protein
MSKYQIIITADDPNELREIADKLSGRAAEPADTRQLDMLDDNSVTSDTPSEKTDTTTKGDVQHASEDATDVDGMPFNAEYHQSPPVFKSDGTWTVKRGKATEAKAARSAFKAGGGSVEAPVVEPEPEIETKSDDAMPGMVMVAEIEPREPITRDDVFVKVTEMMKAGKITAQSITPIYTEITGETERSAVFAHFGVNETACRKLMDHLESL